MSANNFTGFTYIFDVFVTLFITLLIELPLSLIFRHSVLPTSRLTCVANPEFNLVGSTLDMVYSQSICWLGMFYCPVLPIITTVKCVIVFYVKYFSLLVYSCPPSRVYGASSSTSLFMNVLLVSFISCVSSRHFIATFSLLLWTISRF